MNPSRAPLSQRVRGVSTAVAAALPRTLYLGVLMVVSATVLSACGNPFTVTDDLREFVENSGKGLKGRVAPLPPTLVFNPLPFNASDNPDPFAPRRLLQTAGPGTPAPDANRQKEFLETFPLGSLHISGYAMRGGRPYAMIIAPNGSMVLVQQGNHMGLNYGRITHILTDGIALQETVQDDRGQWSEKPATLLFTPRSGAAPDDLSDFQKEVAALDSPAGSAVAEHAHDVVQAQATNQAVNTARLQQAQVQGQAAAQARAAHAGPNLGSELSAAPTPNAQPLIATPTAGGVASDRIGANLATQPTANAQAAAVGR